MPQVMSLLFVAFISLFMFDVFGEYQGWELVLALFMHLLPSFVLLAVIICAYIRTCRACRYSVFRELDARYLPSDILASFVGSALAITVKDGKLMLGNFQRVVVLEFSGPGKREVGE